MKDQAADVRRQFGLLDTFVPTESQINQVFNFWRGLIEARNILVFQTTKIALGTFRGLSIHHDRLPVILINGGDSASGGCVGADGGPGSQRQKTSSQAAVGPVAGSSRMWVRTVPKMPAIAVI